MKKFALISGWLVALSFLAYGTVCAVIVYLDHLPQSYGLTKPGSGPL